MKIGDKVKLISYSGYPDYENHKGETAVVTKLQTGDARLSIEVTWKSGAISHVDKHNIVTSGEDKTLKEVINDVVRNLS